MARTIKTQIILSDKSLCNMTYPNGPFGVALNLITKARLSAKLSFFLFFFLVLFAYFQFHDKNCSRSLTFMMRFKATRKGPIQRSCISSEVINRYQSMKKKVEIDYYLLSIEIDND